MVTTVIITVILIFSRRSILGTWVLPDSFDLGFLFQHFILFIKHSGLNVKSYNTGWFTYIFRRWWFGADILGF